MLCDIARLRWLTERSKTTETRLAPRNSSLGRPGDASQRVRVITSGWAFRFQTLHDGRRQILEILLPGDVLGLEVLLGCGTSTSVQTSTEVIYMALDTADLLRAFETSAEFRTNVLQLMTQQQLVLQGMVIGLGQCNAEERTSALLGDLYTRLLACGLAVDYSYVLELTQLELSDALGLHLIHLNRVLNRLRGRKLLLLEKRRVTLLDPQGLASLTPWITLSHDDEFEKSRPGSATAKQTIERLRTNLPNGRQVSMTG